MIHTLRSRLDVNGSSQMSWVLSRRAVGIGCLAVLLGLVKLSSVMAQGESVAVPKRDYFLSFSYVFDGDFDRGARAFRSAARSGIRSTEGRWIDSICYATMMGECMYRMGQVGPALEQYEIALKLFLVHQNWMRQVEFPLVIEPSRRTLRRPITWGTSRRQTVMARIPDTVSITQALFRQLQIGKQTGVVATQQLFPIHAKEIARCTTIALRRRREIMGPVCKYSPLTIQLLDALGRRPGPANHWTQSWIDLQLGILMASVGKDMDAQATLQRSLLISGRFDHELTSIALLELGDLALKQNKYDEAGVLFLEASISAGAFEQFDVVEEALTWGLKAHLASGKQGLYAPLPLAAQWSRAASRLLEASLYVAAAENYAVFGDLKNANLNVQRAQQAMNRREMLRGELGARLTYTKALLQFQQGNMTVGRKILGQALAYQQKASARLLQLKLADAIGVAGSTTDRVSSELYEATLQMPTEKDWLLRPRDSLTFLMTPHELPLQHWFEILLQRKEPERAFEIVDQIRSHRFTSNLELGGRLMALRWTLEAPRAALSEDAWTQRQVLTAKYPKYANHSIDAKALRGELGMLPLIPGDDEAGRDHLELLKRLHEISGIQEVMLHEMALKPHATETAFPPACDVKNIQENLAAEELVLSFYVTTAKIHVFALRKNRFDYWAVDSPRKIQSEMKNGLRQIGNMHKDAPVDFATVIGEAWKEPMTILGKELFKEAPENLWAGVQRLAIVPDGFLWYLPFEALLLDGQLLFSKYPMRYVPTLSLALGDGRGPQPVTRTALVETELIAGEPDEVGIQGIAQLTQRIAGLNTLPLPHVVPSNLIIANCHRLLVMSDLPARGRGPFQWAPIAKERAGKGDFLDSWFELPWGSCDQLILPGFHTAAEDALRRGGNGNELFLSVCGLMASGTRTIVISRWRTASPLTYPLMGEFTDQLTRWAPDKAWQETVKWFSRLPLDPAKEPRVKAPDAVIPVTVQHPFFWAGYILVDSQREKPAAAGAP
jgi:tetratricopeptide (TPR) repeat protein